ncbi:MAG: hypothetical protein LBE85_03805, partial [Candidatus Accumulibacter sp.]|nr:hypothetical protein [Accumulibacter sp.]
MTLEQSRLYIRRLTSRQADNEAGLGIPRKIVKKLDISKMTDMILPQAASRKPQAASRKPQAASRKPQAASRKPQAASRNPQAARSKTHAA